MNWPWLRHVAAPEEANAGELVLGRWSGVAPRGGGAFEVAGLEAGSRSTFCLKRVPRRALGLATCQQQVLPLKNSHVAAR